MSTKTTKKGTQKARGRRLAGKPGQFARFQATAWTPPEVIANRDSAGRFKVPDVVHEVTPRLSQASLRHRCSRKGTDTMRDCHVELVFNGGSFLRLCSRVGKDGTLVPVANHREATAIAERFCACVKERGQSKRRACAAEIAPNAGFGGAYRRRK